MSRFLIALALVLALGLSVTGCGENTDAPSDTPAVNSEDAEAAIEARDAAAAEAAKTAGGAPMSPADINK